ncbi:Ccm1 protein [Starmerella bacillaris]|uniref:Ccm1 protein n=1 Tax=Starmerella bacillaris TaxID=1247836 RepID=A0AAV5RGP2_STABA|nr:Ccm1 protein [Starmerella bacillaris]
MGKLGSADTLYCYTLQSLQLFTSTNLGEKFRFCKCAASKLMLRNSCFSRRLGISCASTLKKNSKVRSQFQDKQLKEELRLLTENQRKIKEKAKELKQIIKDNREKDKLKWLAQKDSLQLSGEATTAQIDSVQATMNLTPVKIKQIENGIKTQISDSQKNKILPQSVMGLLSSKSDALTRSDTRTPTWLLAVHEIDKFDSSIPVADIEQFVHAIPLNEKARHIVKLETMIPESHRSQYIKDNFMAAYAQLRDPEQVNAILSTCESPTLFSYSHLAKARFRTHASPEAISDVIEKMEARNLKPNLQIYTTLVQSFIQNQRFSEAESVFSNMKYMSLQTQPDTRLYNSMILAAAKYNVNRALDLFEEMQSKQPKPVEADENTYNMLVYACARDPKTHTTAWNLFSEALNRGYVLNNETCRALMYLCGSSGELLLARGLVKRISEISSYAIDNFVLNCLFTSYWKWEPKNPATNLSMHTMAGQGIRRFLISDDSKTSTNMIPFLPTTQLNAELVLAESLAVFKYFSEISPEKLSVTNMGSAMYGKSTTLINLLKTVIKLGSIEDFKNVYSRYTSSDKTNGITTFTIPRDHYIYMVALNAAIKFKDVAFGKEVWTERGEWRKSASFRSMTQAERNRLDFKFAKSLIDLLTVIGNLDEAVALLRSASKLHNWKWHDVIPLIEQCKESENDKLLAEIKGIINKNKKDTRDAQDIAILEDKF